MIRRTSIGLLLAAMATGASAQVSLSLYNPTRTIADQGIALKSWGSGTIAQSDETSFEGTNSIRVSTRNFFMGGRMILNNPIDLSKAFDDPNELMVFAFQVPGTGPGGGASGPAGGPPGRAGAGGGLAGGPGLGGGGLAGAGGQMGAAMALADLEVVRMVVTTTDGRRSEAYVPVKGAGTAKDNWRVVGIPLRGISGFERTNKIVKEIAFSGDTQTTFYIGEIKIVSDPTPIHGEPRIREFNLALGDEVDFVASGFGGSTLLRYTWDFDSSDGVQVEAEGQVVRRKFRKPGTYTVTLTISDVFGLKQPYSTTIKVVVNP